MRSILFLFIFLNFKLSFSQNWSLSPFIGNAVMVSGTDKGLRLPNSLENYDVSFSYPKFNYSLMSPLTFGLKLNYKRNRITYSLGGIFGDQSWSNVRSFVLKPNDLGLIYNSAISNGNGSSAGLLISKFLFHLVMNSQNQCNVKMEFKFNYILG